MSRIPLLADEPDRAMEFVVPDVPEEFLEPWPELLDVARLMDGIYWHQLAQAIEGTAVPNPSVEHNCTLICIKLEEFERLRELLS